MSGVRRAQPGGGADGHHRRVRRRQAWRHRRATAEFSAVEVASLASAARLAVRGIVGNELARQALAGGVAPTLCGAASGRVLGWPQLTSVGNAGSADSRRETAEP